MFSSKVLFIAIWWRTSKKCDGNLLLQSPKYYKTGKIKQRRRSGVFIVNFEHISYFNESDFRFLPRALPKITLTQPLPHILAHWKRSLKYITPWAYFGGLFNEISVMLHWVRTLNISSTNLYKQIWLSLLPPIKNVYALTLVKWLKVKRCLTYF